MALTAADFPNETAYRAYLASEAAKPATTTESTKATTKKTATGGGGGGGGGGGAAPVATTPPDVITKPAGEEITMVEDTATTEDGMTEYERRMLEIQQQLAQKQMEAYEFKPREDARDVIRRVLAQYKLESLTDAVWTRYAAQEVNVDDENALIFSIKEEDAYRQRFAANQKRLAAGMAELDPASYIALEDAYKKVLQSNGMPSGFYDSQDDFQAFIEGDVSVTELQNRLQDGYRLVADADPMVKNKMQELYGVSEADLAAYFIDPQRAKPLLVAADYQRQARAAQIAARAQEQGGMTITGAFAEDLARRGITAEQAQSVFADVGALGELRQTFAGETALSAEQIAGAQFGIDVAAAQELERRKRRRVAEFSGGGDFVRTQGEGGGIRVATGTAQ